MESDVADAADHAVVTADDEGAVTGFDYKPDDPDHGIVAAEVIAYDPAALLEVVEELHRELGPDSDAGDSGLGDFGEHLVPRLISRGRTFAHHHDGYWRDLGQPHLYLRAHQDLLTDDHEVLSAPGWPILTVQPQRRPARLLAGSSVEDSLVSPGCEVSGSVVRSVLGPGVVVEPGATVRDSVVFADTVVTSGARIDWSIIDSRCTIGADAVVGEPDVDAVNDSEVVTLIARDSVVVAGARVPAGTRLEPGGTAD